MPLRMCHPLLYQRRLQEASSWILHRRPVGSMCRRQKMLRSGTTGWQCSDSSPYLCSQFD
jgi:hypothetical protein